MFSDIIEINNALSDIEHFISLAEKEQYYTKDNHPSNVDAYYSGYRSLEFNQELNLQIAKLIIDKCIGTSFGSVEIDAAFQLRCYFHYLTENDRCDDSWIHNDANDIYAGVIYLRDGHGDNGTIIYNNPISYINMEKNKMIMYKSKHQHSARNGFGKDATDARLSIVFFIRGLKVTMVKK